MWILRFHLLQTKDYNKISRICKKYGFMPRQNSPIIFAKASIMHMTQKISWRTIAREFGVSYISLYNFHEQAQKTLMLEEIFHVFIDRRITLYIGDIKHIERGYLDNNEEILKLTKKELLSMLKTSS